MIINNHSIISHSKQARLLHLDVYEDLSVHGSQLSVCNKEPARSKQNTPNAMGVYCVPKPLVGGFGCDELVLYGIRLLEKQLL